ncbi:ATP synthase F1 delta [Heterostelium album PN500]|uniref:ATP synthase F1 delta n=1 Tax=Heterostelium pallidum (strain ATCC 26659 / Pp 5 / PN500) TaxID=670386 RepID=D3BU60_HETP5|nr:ATP synthase F1 delta [Heterostelium album PN500]EFA75061.1 ATP synthase F1 delta [Heterostelium album PN500]|eukprot:XP_020427195.1 ATP synthase F1 delta [Heterostelium album PN500]
MFKNFIGRTSGLVRSSMINNNNSYITKRTFASEGAAVNADDLLSFSFMVPHQILFKNKKVQMLTLPGARGVFGVLKNHIPKIAELKPGVVQVHHESGDVDKYFISGGFAFINPDASCYINAVEAVPVDQLDANEVKNGLARYTQLYNEASDEAAKATALIGLEAHQQMAYACGVSL